MELIDKSVKKPTFFWFLPLFLSCIILGRVSLADYFVEKESWRKLYIDRLLTVGDSELLSKQIIKRKKWNLALKKCRLQVKRNKIPLACYESLILGDEFKKLSPGERKILIREFDIYCKSSLRKSVTLENILTGDVLSVNGEAGYCWSLVKKKKQELLYRKYGKLVNKSTLEF